MSYTLIEPCCGSAALTLHLLGATNHVMPYQGSKWRYRLDLEALIHEMGFAGAPDSVVLTDPGPWPVALKCILDPDLRVELVEQLLSLTGLDPREHYEEIQGAQTVDADENPVRFASEFLFLQRLAFSGKAVSARNGKWSSPGFNTSSAYGLEKTEKFGKMNPLVPSLYRTVRDLELLPLNSLSATRTAATSPKKHVTRPTVVYLDPTYLGTTKYPDGHITRFEVMELAVDWWEAGAGVIISEQEPIAELRWQTKRLFKRRKDGSPFKGKQEEWVTYMAPQGDK